MRPLVRVSLAGRCKRANFVIGQLRSQSLPSLQPVHHGPDLVQDVLVCSSLLALKLCDRGLEVVVVEFVIQADEHLRPDGLVHEDPEGVVAPREMLDLAAAEQVRESRRERLMALQEKISREKLKRKIGKTIKVLVDEPGVGRSSADAPEIDGVVRFKGGKPGEFRDVTIDRADEHDLYGRVQ